MTVRCAMCAGGILKPYFFENGEKALTVDDNHYRDKQWRWCKSSRLRFFSVNHPHTTEELKEEIQQPLLQNFIKKISTEQRRHFSQYFVSYINCILYSFRRSSKRTRVTTIITANLNTTKQRYFSTITRISDTWNLDRLTQYKKTK